MSPEREREFEELTAFLRFYLVERRGVSAAAFDESAAGIAEEFGRSKALVGLRQAVNDTIEELSSVKGEAIALLETALAERGLVSFAELRRRYSAQYQRVLKRGAIRNETEFYLVSGVVSDLSAEIPAEERSHLQLMLSAYERIT
jgi:hypothetical protein